MESLNLNTLASSLPTAQQNAEKELLNNFKAAALSITTLYRTSRQNSKRAYNAGYAAACEDLLSMIQQGVSVGGVGAPGSGSGSHDTEGGGMTIGRVMDWTEARLEAIKSREEEEDEEEEREKEKERGRPSTSAVPVQSAPKASGSKPTAASVSAHRPNNLVFAKGYLTDFPCTHVNSQPSSLPTPNSPVGQTNNSRLPEPLSPSPPPPTALRPIQRLMKPRPSAKGDQVTQFPPASNGPSNINFMPDNMSSIPSSPPFPDTPISIGAGAKRRHAMMMMLDSASSPVSINGGSTSNSSPGTPGSAPGGYGSSLSHGTGSTLSRRRTRNSRNLPLQQPQNQNINVTQAASESMDVEEDGRERKRVARERRQ
ncbi:hypothetical protein BDQ12DRAFT_700918 [Crucibulum laeve]|uniref:Uncharacterized protein n=1 Tax=Crucibulum laeve TaxID=68775 RepID=A0A5C3LKD8_9AGAR|nr:hypothetical protein BDQ12DRAFT_700918 [Crucibulum laeve]